MKIQTGTVFFGASERLSDDEVIMNESAEQKLATLRDRFAQSLPQRFDAIEQALDGDPAKLERLLHSLAGTAGTYGFAELSALARAGEEGCGHGAHVGVILAQMREGQAEAWHDVGQASACPPRILCLEDDLDHAARRIEPPDDVSERARTRLDVSDLPVGWVERSETHRLS